jgi:hypothetical protein
MNDNEAIGVGQGRRMGRPRRTELGRSSTRFYIWLQVANVTQCFSGSAQKKLRVQVSEDLMIFTTLPVFPLLLKRIGDRFRIV